MDSATKKGRFKEMENKFTKGPWKVSEKCNGECESDYPQWMQGSLSITTDEGFPWYIAKLENCPNPEGNARLIAAAPELFEACCDALKLLEGEDEFYPYVELMEKLQSAISKVKGDD
jgi:hypothetical protein